MPAPPVLLLRVAATWYLPGLGLLALPEGASPQLLAYPLHAAVAVEAAPPDGRRRRAVATVEEITRSATTERGLLLDFTPELVDHLPVGTEIWLLDGEPGELLLG